MLVPSNLVVFMCRNVDQYKERNRRLEQESKQHQGEVENAKAMVKQKEEESRGKDKQVEEAKAVNDF